MTGKTSLSLVIPCFNEAGNLPQLHRELTATLDTIPDCRYELVFVDDGSTDTTLAMLQALVADDPAHVRVVELSRNFGKEAALTAGIDHCAGAAVIPFDADLQDPPELIPALVAEWRKGFEVVLARRARRDNDSYIKRKTAELFYSLHNSISDLRIPGNVGDFRLMDRVVIDTIRQLPERQRFMKGLFAWAGFKTTTIDYDRAPRDQGHTKFSLWRLWNLALEGITSFSTAPLRIWTYLGSLGALATLLYGLFIIARTLIQGADVPGYASLLVAILFYGSLQLIGIGILGEYIGRIYMETKQRPTYVVRKTHGDRHAS